MSRAAVWRVDRLLGEPLVRACGAVATAPLSRRSPGCPRSMRERSSTSAVAQVERHVGAYPAGGGRRGQLAVELATTAPCAASPAADRRYPGRRLALGVGAEADGAGRTRAEADGAVGRRRAAWTAARLMTRCRRWSRCAAGRPRRRGRWPVRPAARTPSSEALSTATASAPATTAAASPTTGNTRQPSRPVRAGARCSRGDVSRRRLRRQRAPQPAEPRRGRWAHAEGRRHRPGRRAPLRVRREAGQAQRGQPRRQAGHLDRAAVAAHPSGAPAPPPPRCGRSPAAGR